MIPFAIIGTGLGGLASPGMRSQAWLKPAQSQASPANRKASNG